MEDVHRPTAAVFSSSEPDSAARAEWDYPSESAGDKCASPDNIILSSSSPNDGKGPISETNGRTPRVQHAVLRGPSQEAPQTVQILQRFSFEASCGNRKKYHSAPTVQRGASGVFTISREQLTRSFQNRRPSAQGPFLICSHPRN